MPAKQVFFSHSSKDNAFCGQILERLQEADVDVWYDEHFLKGQILDTEIHAHIRRCDYFLVALSPAAAHSEWVQRECQWAHAAGKTFIITVVADLVEDDKAVLPSFMSSTIMQWAIMRPLELQSATKYILDFLGLIPRPALLRLFGHRQQKQGTVALEPDTQVCLYVDPLDGGQLYFTLGGTAHARARHSIVVQRLKNGAAPCRWTFIEKPLIPSQSQLNVQCNGTVFLPQQEAQALWTPLQDSDRIEIQDSLTDNAKTELIARPQALFPSTRGDDLDTMSMYFALEYHGYA